MESAIYSFKINDINGNVVDFATLKGKVLLIVNTASKCGFTGQYAELEELYLKYHNLGLEILAFPCNQFASQEPEGEDIIKRFCSLNYNITFTLMQKIEVNGVNTHPLYQLLKQKAKGIFGTTNIKWNFTKFIVNRDASKIMRYSPVSNPLRLDSLIKKLLSLKVNN